MQSWTRLFKKKKSAWQGFFTVQIWVPQETHFLMQMTYYAFVADIIEKMEIAQTKMSAAEMSYVICFK